MVVYSPGGGLMSAGWALLETILGIRKGRRVNAGFMSLIVYLRDLRLWRMPQAIRVESATLPHRNSDQWRRPVYVLLLAALAASVTACGTISDDTASRAFAAPGRYDLFPCENIEAQIKSVGQRYTELEQLMARSAQSAGGELVNAIAYRSEYLQAKGTLEELNKASAEKKCAIESKNSSRRKVY
jgi:hypothetical protein